MDQALMKAGNKRFGDTLLDWESNEDSSTDEEKITALLSEIKDNLKDRLKKKLKMDTYVEKIARNVNIKAKEEFSAMKEEVETSTKRISDLERNIEIIENDIKKNTDRLYAIDSETNKIAIEAMKIFNEELSVEGDIKEMEAELLRKKETLAELKKKRIEKKEAISSRNKMIHNLKENQVKSKQEIESIQKKIAELKEDISSIVNGKKSNCSKTNDFIVFLDKQIAMKKEGLECPVCYHPVSPPIYGCSKFHLICHDCKPRIYVCAECREPYKGNIRHRYAESAWEELRDLEKTREEHLKKK